MIEKKESRIFDALVIGSGASGSFAAKELTEQGLTVALVEAGPNVTPEDFSAPSKGPIEKGIQLWRRAVATLQGQHVQAKVAFFGDQFKHLFVNDIEHPYTTTKQQPYLWIRGKQLGGRLHTYGRVLLRWSDTDFRAGERDGKSENWPIKYADLAPFYDRVEQFLGVYGTAEGIKNFPDGKFAKPSKLTALEQRLKQSVESDGSARRVVPWRYMPPNEKRIPQPILAAQKTGRLTIYTDSIVSKVLTNATGSKALGVKIVDRSSLKRSEIRAKVVVLCCSPIETIRLLLNSASETHPNGLANASGTLGRYFMDQVPSLIYGNVPDHQGQLKDNAHKPDPVYGVTGGAYIPRWINTQKSQKTDFARGFGFQGTVGRLFVKPEKNSQFAFMGFGEMLPNADNRVTLNKTRRDRWGIPVPHVRCWLGDNERRMLIAQTDTIKSMVEHAGFEVEWTGSPLGLKEYGPGAYPNEDPVSRFFFRTFFRDSMTMGAAIHESGGARMGADRETSVLNAHNQSWEVPNLFVTDASCFPTSGTCGTTLTIMALTVRACEHIATELTAGRL